MNAGFTPGPWSISYGYDLTGGRIGTTRAHYVCGPDPKSIGIKLATPWVEGAWDDDPEAKANARLIAAAPDMFEALETWVASTAHPPVAAVAALAKARGEP